MSRSKHGHKHIGRSKCWVCSGHNSGRDAPRKAREREHGAQDTEEGLAENETQREEKE